MVPRTPPSARMAAIASYHWPRALAVARVPAMTDRAPLALRGVLVPLVTPFRDGAVDLPALRRLAERLVEDGVSGLVAGATTGEAMALSGDELAAVIAAAREA